MDDRLKKLLCLAIEDVIETGEPVGSQRLVEAHGLNVSPATIRNWFTELEEEGYMMQPHTSSGRIPTEKGYRLYLDELMEPKQLSKKVRADLEHATSVKQFAKTSAEIMKSAALIGLNEADTFYTGLSHLFSQPEFRELNRVVSLTEVLDRLDDVLQRVRHEMTFREPTALIGTACPFGNACGAIVLTLPNGTLLGLLGPMRMDYREGFALLSAAKELLNA